MDPKGDCLFVPPATFGEDDRLSGFEKKNSKHNRLGIFALERARLRRRALSRDMLRIRGSENGRRFRSPPAESYEAKTEKADTEQEQARRFGGRHTVLGDGYAGDRRVTGVSDCSRSGGYALDVIHA
jgi:hypothetical protein